MGDSLTLADHTYMIDRECERLVKPAFR